MSNSSLCICSKCQDYKDEFSVICKHCLKLIKQDIINRNIFHYTNSVLKLPILNDEPTVNSKDNIITLAKERKISNWAQLERSD